MMTQNSNTTAYDWQGEITHRFEIQPTIEAMQRHLLFSLRSASVQSALVGPGAYQTDVARDGISWVGSGASAAEAMGRALLLMTQADGSLAEPTATE